MENKLEYAITEEETRIADRSVALAVEAGALLRGAFFIML